MAHYYSAVYTDCIRHKEELQSLGKVVVFVSQGIISGSDRDFLNERINETLDEQYSRNLSRYVSAGLVEKASHGFAVGPPPLGYKSERLPGRKGERKVPDLEGMPALLNLLRDYTTGNFSFRDVADRLNAQNFQTRTRRPFTGASIRDVLENCFYEGKVVYHLGLSDEVVVDGTHEVTQEITKLWLKRQETKARRRNTTAGHPRGQTRHFPFARVLTCQRCGDPYYGEAVRSGEKEDLRLSHERRGSGRHCDARPRSRSVPALMDQMARRVMPHMKLDSTWKARITAVLRAEEPEEHDNGQQDRLQRALENLRKQHKWGDLTDLEYRRERDPLMRQLRTVDWPQVLPELPNLERAATLLEDLPTLWMHSGVTHEQRESLIREVFRRITIDGKEFVSFEPQPAYVPLFATIVTDQEFGYRVLKSPPSPPSNEWALQL